MKKPPRLPGAGRFFGPEAALFPRLLGVVAVLLGFALFSWPLSRLSRIRDEVGTLTAQAARLTSEIETMKSQWPESRTGRTEARQSEAQAALLHGPAALADWMQALKERAIPLALDAEFELLGARTQKVDRVLHLMRTRLDLHPSSDVDSPRASYQRLLEFGRLLSTNPQRYDFVQLDVAAASDSVGSATIVLDVWADNPAPVSP